MPSAASAAVSGLYPIVDFEACARHGVDPLELASAVLDAAPSLLQVRAKRVRSGQLLPLLDALSAKTRAAGVALVVNDRADLAALSGAPFVHVGQDDLSVAEVRRFEPTLAVGRSTHTLEQLEVALAEAPDYVAFGPVFATESKERPDAVVGVELLQQAHARARAAGVPLVAIGGITAERCAQVRSYCEAVAVISALFEAGVSAQALATQVRTLVARCV